MKEIEGASVTVVVPCFNSEKTICRCVDSLLSQTIAVQVIIVNDGSKDSTLEIADKYATENANVKVISHDNRGLPQSRKAGLEQVETKYVAFVDSDDWVENDMFETLLALSEKYQAEISTCGLYYDTEKNSRTSKGDSAELLVDGVEALRLLHERVGVYPFMCNKLFLSELLKGKEFPTGNFLGEDYATLVPCLSGAEKIVVTNVPLYHYILKEGSMSKSGYGPSYRKAFDTYKSLYEKYKAVKNVCGNQNEMAVYLCVEFSAIYVAMIRNSNYDEEVVEYIRRFLRKNLKNLFKSKVALYFKASALLIAEAPFVFKNVYKIIQKII